jgi:phosphoglycolate phosphatase-like HAD superfamily hydrolase
MNNLAPVTDLRAVIVDADGTLVDSSDAHADAWVEALRAHGYDTTSGLVRRVIGMGGDKVVQAVTGLDQVDPTAQRITAARCSIFAKRYLARIRPFPNSHALLSRMRADRLRLVVAGSGDVSVLKTLLERTQFLDLIEDIVSSAEVDHSKPDSDLVGAALEALGLLACQALMLGDTPYDIEAARNVGVATIALRSGGWDDVDLKRAVAVYEDPADLLAHYHGSLFAHAVAQRACPPSQFTNHSAPQDEG